MSAQIDINNIFYKELMDLSKRLTQIENKLATYHRRIIKLEKL